MAAEDLAFVPLRPPVLGHVLERDAAGERYRLVELGASRRVVAEGTRERCEVEWAARLEERHPRGAALPLPTLGGLQLWADVVWLADWRIQENARSGAVRLLDPRGVRRVRGTFDVCRAELERRRLAGGIEESGDDLVVLLHGLLRTRRSLRRLAAALRASGRAVALVSYPSTRRSIAEHAAVLERLLDSLEGVRRVSFVTHSLGGLIARAVLARDSAWRRRIELGRLVMIAPPSRGSAFAEKLAPTLPFRLIAGPGGASIARDARSTPLPACPFAIIAARKGGARGLNPLIRGPDDGLVGIDETRLPGAAEFLVVEGLHMLVMRSPEVVTTTLAFLGAGSLSCADP